MSLVLVVAAKDLRQRVRDRSLVIMGLVAPLVLAIIISTALGGVVNSFHTTFALYDGDRGPLARAFGQVLASPQLARVARIRTVDSAAEAVALTRRHVDAAFVIPPGFSAAVTSGQSASVRVIRSRAALLGGEIAVEVASGFTSQVDAASLSVRTALAIGAHPADVSALVARAAAGLPSVSLRDTSSGGRSLKPAAYFGPAMALFFLFFTVGSGARSLMAERRQGTLARLRASPMSPRVLLAGKALASFCLGLASMLTLVLASSILLGARWGQPLALLGVVVSAVLAMVGITALVVAVARTEDQAMAYSSAAAVVLALLGGNFVPIAQAPVVLRRLALVTPNGWALRAFSDLGTGAHGLSVVGPSLAALLAFALVTGALAATRASRMVGL